MFKQTLTALALLLPLTAQAHDYKVGDLMVDHPVARETPPNAMAGAGYMKITNMGDAADRLIAVNADYPRVEIHNVKVENDIATMFQIDGVEIAPGETVTLQPGQQHVMFMGLNGDAFEEGETIPATLIFENAGEVEIVFNVETADQIAETLGVSPHAGHGGHGDHGSDKKDDHSSHNH